MKFRFQIYGSTIQIECFGFGTEFRLLHYNTQGQSPKENLYFGNITPVLLADYVLIYSNYDVLHCGNVYRVS